MPSSTSSTLAEDVVTWFTDTQARQDPYPFFDRLREREPVHFSEQLNTWVLTRYQDAEYVFRNAPVVRSPEGSDVSYMYDEAGELRPTWRMDRGTHRWHDGKELDRVRRLVSQAMGPRQIRTWHGQIKDLLDEEVEQLLQSTEADLIEDFVYKLPMRMICNVFGVPASDHDKYRNWTEDWFSAFVFVADRDVQERGDAAALEFEAHILQLVDEKRHNPDESMLSHLIRARDSEDRLRDDELVAMTASMLGAGHETTGSLVGNAALALLRNPDQMARLRADVSLVSDTVEETLRYEPSSMLTPRYAAADFELNGQRIKTGDALQIIIQATGRSPDTYDDPNRFWIERPAKNHVAFAAGPHFCCGAQLARVEAQLMIEAIPTRFPDLEMTTDSVTWKPILGIRGLASLPVRWSR
jgi:pimeloyl-[acyl-carrier protein] synthase